MGVYHLMGLGTSVGAVTAPLSYLAHRYQRWNQEDQHFFARSGEWQHREAGRKVGDVQALALFTTNEVLSGSLHCRDYLQNLPGSTKGSQKDGGPMRKVLRRVLCETLPNICGGRREIELFWCEIDRRDIHDVYTRVVRLVAALTGVGGQGKEMWANLTGGNNVTNFALELAATLSGSVARMYYVQAHDQAAEKCVCHTAENGYWVDLPVMPLALGRLRETIIHLLEEHPMTLDKLHSRLQYDYWDLSRGLDSAPLLKEEYLATMLKQGLIAQIGLAYTIGPQWETIRTYQELLDEARMDGRTLEELAREEPWIERDEICLGGTP